MMINTCTTQIYFYFTEIITISHHVTTIKKQEILKDNVKARPTVHRKLRQMCTQKKKKAEGKTDVKDLKGPNRPIFDEYRTANDEGELMRHWDRGKARQVFEAIKSTTRYLLKLWKVTEVVMRCSPWAILSPVYGLCVRDEEGLGQSGPILERSVWPKALCTRLGALVCHPLWETQRFNLLTALQFVVMCRLGDWTEWSMPMEETDNLSLEQLRKTFKKPRERTTRPQKVCSRLRELVEKKGLIPQGVFPFFCRLASQIDEPRRPTCREVSDIGRELALVVGDLDIPTKALDSYKYGAVRHLSMSNYINVKLYCSIWNASVPPPGVHGHDVQ